MHFFARQIGTRYIEFPGGDTKGQHLPFARESGGERAGDGGRNKVGIRLAEGEIVLETEGDAEFLFRDYPEFDQVFTKAPAFGFRGEGGFELLRGDPLIGD